MYNKMSQDKENDISRFHKFVKNEIIEIAEIVDEIKENQRR